MWKDSGAELCPIHSAILRRNIRLGEEPSDVIEMICFLLGTDHYLYIYPQTL